MIAVYDPENIAAHCNALAEKHGIFKKIIGYYGYPPNWARPNTFASLVWIILEQQVSLASALAAFEQLQKKIQHITPENFLQLSDADLRLCYFSRQKVAYVHALANALQSGSLNLKHLEKETDDAVRIALKSIKGIGNWTADIYLIHVLKRADVFPIGDLALRKAMTEVLEVSAAAPQDLLKIAECWRPQRTIATLMLWHYYLQTRRRKA